VQRNSLGGTWGIANLGRGGVVYADSNWWGCNMNPIFPIAAWIGCSGISGNVSVTNWLSAPPK
jgi:hypothetical protein